MKIWIISPVIILYSHTITVLLNTSLYRVLIEFGLICSIRVNRIKKAGINDINSYVVNKATDPNTPTIISKILIY